MTTDADDDAGDTGYEAGHSVVYGRKVLLHDADGLTVVAYRGFEDGLVFSGVDTRGFPGRPGTYAYSIATDAEGVRKVMAALGADPASDDVLDVVARHGRTIVKRGESRFLQAIGADWDLQPG